ncbi:unnamed protein product [marine sediment metagenome]|uniref:Uncharacterized protein n=1 Tax=marine sediment metagenome TaxID=412755 RepID=X1E845_9ZZZZ
MPLIDERISLPDTTGLLPKREVLEEKLNIEPEKDVTVVLKEL